jgi:hypothetical protein
VNKYRVETTRLSIDRDELLIEFFDSGNRIDRTKKKKTVEFVAAVGVTTTIDRDQSTDLQWY